MLPTEISSPIEHVDQFIRAFVGHTKNCQYLVELERPVDELTRAGDLFPVLLRNEAAGMSYMRTPGAQRAGHRN